MANPLSSLKGGGFKETLLAHGEKVGLALFVLIGLGVLWTTRFSGIEKTPRDLDEQAALAQTRLDQSVWSDEEKQTVSEPLGVQKRVTTLVNSERTATEYVYNKDMSPPLYPPVQAIQEPQWLTIEELRANPGMVILDVTPDAALGTEVATALDEDGNPVSSTEDKPADIRDDLELDLGERTKGARGTGAGSSEFDEYDTPPAATSSDYGPGGGEMYNIDGMESGEYGSMSNRKGEGHRYVAVRGVFDLRRQLELVGAAMNIRKSQIASLSYSGSQTIDQLVFIKEFMLERMEGPADKKAPFADAKWEQVDIADAASILERVVDYEPDEVDPAVYDPAITMPLPARVTGRYGYRASHPRLKEFELDEEEAAKQNEINRQILEEYNRLAEKEAGITPKGGFAAYSVDIQRARGAVFGDAEASASLTQRFSREYSSDGSGQAYVNQLVQQNSAAGQILLFRYLDFDVEPGMAYKYRVKLSFKNPLYGKPREELAHADLGDDLIITDTKWSNETEVVSVSEGTAYQIDNVSYARRESDLPTIGVEVFHWYPETGTVVHKTVPTQPGEYIGGKTTASVIDVAKETWEDEAEVELMTNDLLVDIAGAPLLERADHPLLGLSASARINRPIDEFAIILDDMEELSLVDAVAAGDRSYAALKKRHEAEEKAYESFKKKAVSPEDGSADYMLYGEMYSEELFGGEEGPSRGSRNRRRRNALRQMGGCGP